MKKGIKNLAIATMVGVASMGLMTGCKKEEDKPYIQVRGLDTAYIQNEDINLEGAKILYYSNIKDTTADEIALTESMIANFDTDTTGQKKMKVLWNNFELEINYSVISTTDFINIYNTAYDNLMNAEYVHGDATHCYGSPEVYTSANVANNKFYIKTIVQGTTEKDEEWCEQYSGVWYRYNIEGEEKTREDISSEITNGKVMEYVMTCFIGQGSKLNEEALGNVEITIDIEGTKIILSIKVFDEEYNETNITKFIIENNKFVGCNFKVENAEGEINTMATSIISYNAEDVEMVDLPTNVQWEDVE